MAHFNAPSASECLQTQISHLNAEYAFELSLKSELQIDREKVEIAKRRKIRILSYYQHYIFQDYLDDDSPPNGTDAHLRIASNPQLQLTTDTHSHSHDGMLQHFEQTLEGGIYEDYQHILTTLRDEQIKKLEQQEMLEMHSSKPYRQPSAYDDELEFDIKHDAEMQHVHSQQVDHAHEHEIEGMHRPLRPPPPPPDSYRARGAERRKSVEYRNQSNVLYQVDPMDERAEKEWMKQLKRRRFKIYLNAQKYQRLQIQRIELESRIQEFNTQNAIKEKLKRLEDLHRTVHKLTEHRIEYVKNVNMELNSLRSTIAKLMRKCAEQVGTKGNNEKIVDTPAVVAAVTNV